MANEVKLKLAIEGGRIVVDQIDDVGASLGKLEGKAKSAGQSSDTLRNVLAGIATVGTAVAIIKMADAASTLHSQLRLATGSAQAADQAYTALFDIAQKSRVNFMELGHTYTAVARAGQELGISQARLLTVTQSISQAMTIGGGSAASMQAALVQLGQGLSSGTLRGEELNSIMEQTPRLAKAIADGLGVPIGELRHLGETGQLTAQQVISALEKSGPQLAKEMAGATLTVGQAFTMLGNSATKFVGDADAASGASKTLAGFLQSVAGMLDTVGEAIRNHETAFGVITAGLAGAATIAGVAALASGIGVVTTALVTMGTVLMAHPVILAIAGIAAAAMALKSAADSAAKSEAGMGYAIADLDAKIARSEATRESLTEAGAKRLGLMRAERARLQGELALLSSKGLDTRVEDARLGEGVAAFKASQQAQKDLIAIRQKLSGVDQDYLPTLEKLNALRVAGTLSEKAYVSMVSELASKTYKPSDADKLAQEAAKQSLGQRLKLVDDELAAISAGEKRKQAALKTEQALGVLSQAQYYDQVRAMAEQANAREQALVQQQIDAVKLSAQPQKDKLADLEKYNSKLKALKEEELGIVLKARNDLALLANKQKLAGDAVLDAQREEGEKATAEANRAREAAAARGTQMVNDYAEALKEQNRLIGVELGLLGQTQLARDIALGQYRVALELRKQIAAIIDNKGFDQADRNKEIGRVTDLAKKANLQAGVDAVIKSIPDDPFRDWGTSLKATFGSAADGLVSVVSSMKTLSDAAKDYDLGMRKVADLQGSGELEKAAKVEQALIAKRESTALNAYASMAGAAKSYFAQNSTGYKVLAGVEKAAHLVQMAMLWEKLYTSLFVSTASATGVVAGQAVETGAVVTAQAAQNTAKIPGVFMSFMSSLGPWGAAAAAVAIAAVLGGAGGGGAPKITMDGFAEQKANTGTGTVFGDKNAQSESIKNSLAALESMARPELSFTSQMVGLLREINDGLAGTTNAILSSGFDLSGSDFKGSKEQDGGGIWGAIFGTESSTTTLSDLGLAFGKQTIAAAMKAIEVQSYQVTKTDWSASGFLGIGSESGTDYTSSFAKVDDKVAASMSQVVKQLVTAVSTVGAKLGATPEQLAAMQQVDSGLGKVSLIGKSGEDVQKLLSAVFSAMGDQMAQAVMPDLGDFRKVGQGYLETLSTVAAGLDEAALYTDKLGVSLVSLAELRNKQGDVGAELVRQSIANAETLKGTAGAMSSIGGIIHNFSGSASDLADLYTSLLGVRTQLTAMGFAADTVSTALLRGAGGLDALQTGLADFEENFLTQTERLAIKQASMDEAFGKIGLTTPKTTADFKDLVFGLRSGGAASQELLGRVLVLSGGFADLVDAVDQADSAVGRLQATMKALESGRAAAVSLAESALQGVKDVIGDAKSAAQKTYDNTIKALTDQEAALTRAYEQDVKRQNDLKQHAADVRKYFTAELDAERKAAAAAYKSATGAIADERKLAVNAYKVAGDAIKASIDAANKSIGLLKSLDSSLRSAMNFYKQNDKSLASREAGQAQIVAALIEAQAGKFPTAESLADALAAVTQPSEDFFESFADYQRDYYRTAISISDLGKLTGTQLNTEEQALQVLTNSQTLMQTQHQTHMERLDAQKEALDQANESLQALFDQRQESITATYDATVGAADDKLQQLKDTYDAAIAGIADQKKVAKSTLDDVVGKLDAQLGAAQSQYDAILGLGKPLTDIAGALANLATALGNFKVADKALDTAKLATGNANISSTDIATFVNQAIASSTDGTGADAAAKLYQYAVANQLSTNQIAGSGANPTLTQANINAYTAQNGLTNIDDLLTANGTTANTLANTATVQAAALVDSTSSLGKVRKFVADMAAQADWTTAHPNWPRELYDFATGNHVPASDVDTALGAAAGTTNAWATAQGLPAFARGTNLVPRDMIAQIHQGEAIIPAAFNPERYNRASGNDALVTEIRALRAEVAALRKDQQAATRTGNDHLQRVSAALNGSTGVPLLVEIAT